MRYYGRGGSGNSIFTHFYGNIESSFDENDLELNNLISECVPQ